VFGAASHGLGPRAKLLPERYGRGVLHVRAPALDNLAELGRLAVKRTRKPIKGGI